MKKFFIIGLLLWVALTLPASAQYAQISEHKIVEFNTVLKKVMDDVGGWKDCGRYFSAAETPEGKFIHFSYEKNAPSDTSPKFVYIPIRNLIRDPFINESMATPMVFVLWNSQGERFAITMNLEDYKVALPCISNVKGTKV